MSFIGFFNLDGADNERLQLFVRTSSTTNVVTHADAVPTYRIYAPATSTPLLASGTMSERDTGVVTGTANNGGAVQLTDAGHGLQTGDKITVTSVGGTTEANGTWPITVQSSSLLTLTGSTYASAWTSGGVWALTGLYYAQVSLTTAAGFERGKYYSCSITYAVSSNTKSEEVFFGVV